MKVSGIKWETDGVAIALPDEVEVPDVLGTDDEIAGWLSDEYGFLVISYSRDMKEGEWDEFGLYVNEVEGKIS